MYNRDSHCLETSQKQFNHSHQVKPTWQWWHGT